MNTIKTYVDQGELSIPKLFIGLGLSLVAAYVLAFLYGVLIAMCPFVYINFFITCGFGMLLSSSVIVISRLIKNTHRKVDLLIGLMSAFAALYFSWLAYFIYIGDNAADDYFTNFQLIFRIDLVYQNLLMANETGLWEMFGVQFTGAVLWIIWGLETGIIFFLTLIPVTRKKTMPFSMASNKWYKKYFLHKDFESIVMQDDFCENLNTDSVKTIDSLGLGRATHYSRISVYYLEKEKEQYLSVENVSKDSDGKKENAVDVIHLLAIKKTVAEELIQSYHAKKASFLDTVS